MNGVLHRSSPVSWSGLDASSSLITIDRRTDAPFDEVVRRAGVGFGTRYRHFPTRRHLCVTIVGQLVAAVVQAEHADVRPARPQGKHRGLWRVTSPRVDPRIGQSVDNAKNIGEHPSCEYPVHRRSANS
ncbi:hypothetical protein [Micromonospora sp. NPDC047527]|uniref:hypothetical protein n=1 Tax=Micromonospora sp. NPDC047527 TaxID=3155144 RepID=UPI0033E3759B